MSFKLRTIILSIGLLISSITLGLAIWHKGPSSFAGKYYTYLAQLEHEAFQSLKTIGLDKTVFEKTHKEIAPFKELMHPDDASHKPSEKATQRISKILQDFSINPASISLVQSKKFAPVSALDLALYVDESSLDELPKRAQKFALGHECQHIINQDYSRDVALYQIFGEKARSYDISHPCNQYYRFLEVRADILTALKSAEYAQGFYEFVDHELTTYGENPGIIHTKNSERIKLAKEICTDWGIQIA